MYQVLPIRWRGTHPSQQKSTRKAEHWGRCSGLRRDFLQDSIRGYFRQWWWKKILSTCSWPKFFPYYVPFWRETSLLQSKFFIRETRFLIRLPLSFLGGRGSSDLWREASPSKSRWSPGFQVVGQCLNYWANALTTGPFNHARARPTNFTVNSYQHIINLATHTDWFFFNLIG